MELLNAQEVFVINLVSPTKTTAIIGIPNTNKNITSIDANGNTVWRNGKKDKTLQGLTFLKNTTDYIKFSVIPGKWTFKAKKNK